MVRRSCLSGLPHLLDYPTLPFLREAAFLIVPIGSTSSDFKLVETKSMDHQALGLVHLEVSSMI